MADDTLSTRMRRGECNAHELALVAKVYDAAVAWRELDSAQTRGTLLAAVTDAKGK